MLARTRREGNPTTLLVGMQAGATTLENSMRFLKKLKMELSYNPKIALLSIYPQDTNVEIRRGTCTRMFIAAMSTIAKLGKEPRCPSTDEWIKIWYIYKWNTMQPSKIENSPFSMTWMELEGIMPSEISQSIRE